jgi:hypothetical protein
MGTVQRVTTAGWYDLEGGGVAFCRLGPDGRVYIGEVRKGWSDIPRDPAKAILSAIRPPEEKAS